MKDSHGVTETAALWSLFGWGGGGGRCVKKRDIAELLMFKS